MRIPHTINPLTLKVYERSVESENLIMEDGIKIDAQDLTWDDDELPTLAMLCVKKIAFYFVDRPWFEEVPCSDRDYLLELLSLDIDLNTIIPIIKSEYYWKRRYAKHFGTIIHPKPKIWNWKSIYIERTVQKMVENAAPQYNDEMKIVDDLQLYAPYVKRLVASQLATWQPPAGEKNLPVVWPTDHIDFTYILSNLQFIEELDIVFGMNDVAFDFRWEMFAVTDKDCLKLGQGIMTLPSITTVRIHQSKIEDSQCQALMKSLVDNKTIVVLDLSNCSIGDRGTLCIAKFVCNSPTLKVLNLNNNLIGEGGTVGLAFALLQENCAPLESLHLSLNPLGRAGSVGIMRALVRGNIPTELSISGVGFEEDMPERLGQLMSVNDSLKILDVSSNFIGEEGGNFLIEGMQGNTCLEWLDVRETGITAEQEHIIKGILKRNRGASTDFEEDDELEHKEAEEGQKVEDEDEDEI